VISSFSSVGTGRFMDVRCIANCFSAVTVGGITYPLASGDWYKVAEQDVVNWIRQGMTFEFKDLNDAIYIQEKYSL